MKRHLFAAVAVTLSLGSTAPALAQKSADTLRFPYAESASTLDTYLNPGSFSNIWGPSVYDHLLGFDAKKGDFVGHLAKAWAQPDPTTYEYELHTDVKWHDGQSFDADDVVYTLNYLIDPKITLRYKAYWAWIKSVEKLAPNKVRITAKQPAADGPMLLASRTPRYGPTRQQARADQSEG